MFLFLAASVFAAPPAQDPLRFISDRADLVIKIEHPRQLVEAITRLDAFKEAQQLQQVRQVLDSAEVRRVFEFIAYYERDLGAKWPELLDKLAGGGIAVGAKIVSDADVPILLVLQGTDEALLIKFMEKASYVIKEELARAESKETLAKEKYKDFETLHLGKDFHACRIGAALLLSNKAEALKVGIDQHIENISKGGKPAKNMLTAAGPAKAKKLLPPNPQAWLWYSLDYLKGRPGAKDVLTTPRNDTILTFLFAGYLDVFRRSEFVAAGLYANPDGFGLTIRMPAGRDGMAEDVELHLPRDAKVAGTLPPLEPNGVIFSHSFYLDLGVLWEKRAKIMNASNAKSFEEGVKQASRFLPGTSIDKLLTQSGVHHRFVVAVQKKTGYTVEPQLRLPAFAFVTTMRDPAFGKAMEVLVRGGAALASLQVKLDAFEDKRGDVAIFGYRFPENGKFAADDQNLRFNFTPSFAIVKDQLIAATNLDLCKELIDIVQKEDRHRPAAQNMQSRLYAKGGGDFLNSSPEGLLTQTILSQAVDEAEAKKQVDRILKFAQKLGRLQIETDYGAKDFRFDVKWLLDK
jgi:hypothetical protein